MTADKCFDCVHSVVDQGVFGGHSKIKNDDLSIKGPQFIAISLIRYCVHYYIFVSSENIGGQRLLIINYNLACCKVTIINRNRFTRSRKDINNLFISLFFIICISEVREKSSQKKIIF